MDKNKYILKDEELVFELSEDKKLIYFYHLNSPEDRHDIKDILKSVNTKLAKDIEEYFEIDIKEYGITIDDSPKREFSKEEKDKVYSERGLMYLTIAALVVFTAFVSIEDNSSGGSTFNGFNLLSYITIFLIGFVLMLFTGREQFEKQKVERCIKYNITTTPPPSKDERIDALEAQVKKLLKDKGA
jgi:hypothetical protein